jgi:ParB/RepB/Spo0J family partition protein
MKSSERKYVELDLASVVSAKENLRDTVRQLSDLGWGVFEAGKERPSLVSLALSKDATEQAQYVALIEDHEPTIKELADNMATTGQLEPIRVRPADDKGKYDLVFGARRTLARLYIHAKSAGKIPARLTAEVKEGDDKDALYASISENIREEPSPLDEARSYERLRKTFGMSPKEIGSATGKSEKVIRLRLKLLKLPKELQERVHLGKIGVERALKHLEGGDDQAESPPRRGPSLKELKLLYEAAPDDLPDEVRQLVTEDVRRLLAHWLGVAYAARQQVQAA